MCFKTMWQKAWQACIGVAGACFLTVLLARLLGHLALHVSVVPGRIFVRCGLRWDLRLDRLVI